MVIKEIELNNFRIYKGSNKIDLSSKANRNIIIVSGRNGFGKTTFLMSMVWCLYGRQMQDVDDLYKKEIAEQGGYGKYISNSLNRMAQAQNENEFSVSVTFQDVNIPEVPCKEITIHRSFNTNSSTADEVDVLIDGYQSELAKEVGPEIFIREFIMPIEIAKFFFFDAEKIVSLAEVNTIEQRRNLSRAYSEVLGIKKYEDLRKELENLQLSLRQETASAEEKTELKQLEIEVESCEEKIAENYRKIDQLREQQNEKSKESRDIQEKLIKAGSVISVDELLQLRDKETEFLSTQDKLQSKLKESFDIIPFAIAGEKLLEVDEQLETEANHKAAKFKNEHVKDVTDRILNELTNTPIPKDIVVDYKARRYYEDIFEHLIRKHFFADSTEVPENFTALHDFSDLERNELRALLSNIRQSFKESFTRINGDYLQVKNELNAVRRRIKDAEANEEDPIITEYRRQKEELDKQVVNLIDTIDSLNREIGVLSNDKTQKEKKIEGLSKKLKVSKDNQQKDDIIQDKIRILKQVIIEFKAKKKASLEKQILEGLSTLMHKKGFIKGVDVDIIGDDIDIVLKNGRGESIKKEALSKGEQQMYATALLRGLVEESDIRFPIFIDSPMQKFDEQHAENIVRYFYPTISEQVVIFPLVNKELTEREFEILSPHISRTVLIENIDPDQSRFIPVEPDQFFKTHNSIYSNAD